MRSSTASERSSGRFRVAPELQRLRLSSSTSRGGELVVGLEFSDGDLPERSLSTGQKTLLAAASMLALNVYRERTIGHGLMLLDDFTTSLDMAQIPAFAHLVRQFAYAPRNSSAKRQVFLSSHHEDLSNRLLDFIQPPSEDFRLRVLNFAGWSLQEGPEIERSMTVSRLAMGRTLLRTSTHSCKRLSATSRSSIGRDRNRACSAAFRDALPLRRIPVRC